MQILGDISFGSFGLENILILFCFKLAKRYTILLS